MIKNILVPTDGSPSSNVALEYGFFLATRFNADLTGLNVIDVRALEGPFLSDISGSLGFSPFQNYLPRFQQILDERSTTILDMFLARCTEKGIAAKVKKLTGIIANIIADESKKSDLVIISQHGEHEQWSAGLLGSTTQTVVRKSSAPVLVTPNTYRDIKKIIIAYDGSPEAAGALKTACELFGKDSLAMTVAYAALDEEKGRALATEISEIVSHYKITHEGVWLQGEAGKEILSYAEHNGFDLIVMGAFGHGRLHDLIIGSTAAYIIRNSKAPILLQR